MQYAQLDARCISATSGTRMCMRIPEKLIYVHCRIVSVLVLLISILTHERRDTDLPPFQQSCKWTQGIFKTTAVLQNLPAASMLVEMRLPNSTAARLGANKDTNYILVAFCSPAKSLFFSGLMEHPFVGKKLKVITSKQNAPKILCCTGFVHHL